MSARRRARLLACSVSLLTLATTPTARADLIVLVDNVEIARVAGPLGIGQTRVLPPTDSQVSDSVSIRGLTARTHNDGGRSGGIEIEIESFTWGTPTQPPPPVHKTSVTVIQDFSLTMLADRSDANLLTHCCQGEAVPFLGEFQSLQIDKVVDVELLRLELSDTLTSGFPFAGASTSGSIEIPAEQLTLSYSKVQWTYTAQTNGQPMSINGFGSTDSWQVVPEPSTLVLFGLGAVGLLGYGWLRRTPA